MQSADLLQQFLSQLPPGAKLSFTVELPPLPESTSMPALGEEKLASVVHSWGGDVSRRVPSGAGREEESVDARVSSLRKKHGGDSVFKAREWSSIVGLSEREIERAMKRGAVASCAKGDGRDHAALTVSIDAMETYLATVKAVTTGTMEPPFWWDSVRTGGKRHSLVGR